MPTKDETITEVLDSISHASACLASVTAALALMIRTEDKGSLQYRQAVYAVNAGLAGAAKHLALEIVETISG